MHGEDRLADKEIDGNPEREQELRPQPFRVANDSHTYLRVPSASDDPQTCAPTRHPRPPNVPAFSCERQREAEGRLAALVSCNALLGGPLSVRRENGTAVANETHEIRFQKFALTEGTAFEGHEVVGSHVLEPPIVRTANLLDVSSKRESPGIDRTLGIRKLKTRPLFELSGVKPQ
jgi:hypothetical protein